MLWRRAWILQNIYMLYIIQDTQHHAMEIRFYYKNHTSDFMLGLDTLAVLKPVPSLLGEPSLPGLEGW